MSEPDMWDHPYYRMGREVGHDFGARYAQDQALKAQELGELDLWLDYVARRTPAERKAWEEENGPSYMFELRWEV